MARENVASRIGHDYLRHIAAQFTSIPHAISFFVPGNPQGKARPQSAVVFKKDGSVARGASGRAVIRHFTPTKTVNYEATIATYFRQTRSGPPFTCPVILVLEITQPVTDSWPKWKKAMCAQRRMLPVNKPDADNIEKAVKDALNRVAWMDDTQVVGSMKFKRFGDTPGVKVIILPLSELPSTLKSLPR